MNVDLLPIKQSMVASLFIENLNCFIIMHKRRHHDNVHFNPAANWHLVAKEENGTPFAELESNDVLHSKINGQTSMQQILDTLYTVLQQLLHHFLYEWPCTQFDFSVLNQMGNMLLHCNEQKAGRELAAWNRAILDLMEAVVTTFIMVYGQSAGLCATCTTHSHSHFIVRFTHTIY